jgi:hypothetical protein
MNKAYNDLVSASSNNDLPQLQSIYVSLIREKMKLDKFFSMYLDKFDKHMSEEQTDTPVWNLYKKKYNEYSELNQTIRAAEYYLKKPRYV